MLGLSSPVVTLFIVEQAFVDKMKTDAKAMENMRISFTPIPYCLYYDYTSST